MSSVDASIPDEIRSVAEEGNTEQLSKDVIFELLKNRRRREVLAYLLESEETVTLGELAEQIAAWENDTEVAALNSDQRKRVYVALYQTHLPKMDDAGIIDYDQDRGLITLSDNADLLVMYLDTENHYQDRWDRWYASLSVVGVALVAGVSLGVGPLALAPSTVVSGLVVGTFLLVSATHCLVNRQRRRTVDDKLARVE